MHHALAGWLSIHHPALGVLPAPGDTRISSQQGDRGQSHLAGVSAVMRARGLDSGRGLSPLGVTRDVSLEEVVVEDLNTV